MTHTPSGLRTNVLLPALFANHVLINTKNFSLGIQFHIHAENAPFIDKLTSYSPSPPPRSFTLRFIPDRFRRQPPDPPPQFFTPRLIPDRFGDFPTY